MTFTIGTFDLFTYAVPGSLYLGLIGYGAVRLDLVEAGELASYPVLMVLVASAVASYLLGHASYGLGLVIDRVVPLWKWRRVFDAHAVFEARTAGLSHRPVLRSHLSLLHTAAELHDHDVAKDIVRLRAIGLMLRNATIPVLLAAVAAGAEFLLGGGGGGGGGGVALACALGLLVIAAGSTWRSFKLRLWANLRTLEICYLMPELDSLILRDRVPECRRVTEDASTASEAGQPTT